MIGADSIADGIVRYDTSSYIELRSTSRGETLLSDKCRVDIGHSGCDEYISAISLTIGQCYDREWSIPRRYISSDRDISTETDEGALLLWSCEIRIRE